MTWNITSPTDTTKLRNLGVEIRPHWEAIETADSTFKPQALNLADRTALGIDNDPTAIADTIILYSKQDGAGKPQAYAIDPDSGIAQVNAIKAWVRFNGNGVVGADAVITDSFNFSRVNKISVNIFKIFYTTDLKNLNYGIIVTADNNVGVGISTGTIALDSVRITTGGASPRYVTAMMLGN